MASLQEILISVLPHEIFDLEAIRDNQDLIKNGYIEAAKKSLMKLFYLRDKEALFVINEYKKENGL